jgi:hypothetical protein
MKTITLAAMACLLAISVFAQSAPSTQPSAPSCKVQATDKKLAGAALNSFMKRCETDAQKACDVQASDKKLSGAAKTSFTKRCVTDSVGSS